MEISCAASFSYFPAVPKILIRMRLLMGIFRSLWEKAIRNAATGMLDSQEGEGLCRWI